MLTVQNYTAGFGCATNWGQAVQNAPSIFPKADNWLVTDALPLASPEEFIIQHADIFGLYPADLATQLTERLQAQPVRYTSVLDGIALIRAFTPKVAAYQETHYGLLLQNDTVVGFVWIPAHTDRLEGDTSVLIAYESETRPLMQQVLALNADRLLLATTRHGESHYFANRDFKEIERLTRGLEVFGVELLDYLLLFDTLNLGYAYEWHGEMGLEDEVDSDQLARHYVDFPPAIQ